MSFVKFENNTSPPSASIELVDNEAIVNTNRLLDDIYENLKSTHYTEEYKSSLTFLSDLSCAHEFMSSGLHAAVSPTTSDKSAAINLPKTIEFVHTLKRLCFDLTLFVPFINETEYSANIIFTNPILPKTILSRKDDAKYRKDPKTAHVYKRLRRYYKMKQRLHFNNNTLSSDLSGLENLEDAQLLPTQIVLRIDNDMNCAEEKPTVTIKTRLARQKFNWHSMELVAKACMEYTLDDIAVDLEKLSAPTKQVEITFWYLRIYYKEQPYLFGIAFRQLDNDMYECNIECEDPSIDGETFGQIYYALYRYYTMQYIVGAGVVEPLQKYGTINIDKYILQSINFGKADIEFTYEHYRMLQTMVVVSSTEFELLSGAYYKDTNKQNTQKMVDFHKHLSSLILDHYKVETE